jgi:cytochrome P450
MYTTWPWLLAATSIALVLFRAIATRYRSDLRKIPGPFLASFTNLDRIWSCAKGNQMNYHLSLHAKHGRLVRVGPNHVSVSDGNVIQQLYSISSKFTKSDFYSLFDIKTPAGPASTTFSVRDETIHKAKKRPVANAFSMSTMRELEPMNDACSEILLRNMAERTGQDVDLGKWLHWYAFDVISSITFSNRLGFMEQEKDVGSIIEAIEGRLVYNSIVGQAPWLHKYLFGNPLVSYLANVIPAVAVMNSSKFIVSFAAKQLERYQGKDSSSNELPDMLDRFKRFKDGEQVMSDSELLSHAVSNIFAGSDTTAASLRAIFYYLCRTPSAHKKVLDELDEANRNGRLSDPITFAEAQDLKYFQAVVKEALRMHPAVGLLLERVVPRGGTEVGGVWLAGGTIVGVNPWVVARSKDVYGEDSEIFKPERWLDADEKRLKAMERNFLAVSLPQTTTTITVAVHATFADVRSCSSVREREHAWGRTSRFWRSANWFLRCCGSSILNCHCHRGRTGSCTTIGSSDRLV